MRAKLLGDLAGALRTNLLEVQQAERQRLAADLHDDPIQVLTVAVMRLDLLRGEIGDDATGAKVDGVRTAVCRTAIDSLRTMLFELAPPSLDRHGLARALDDYTTELFSGTGTVVQVDTTIDRVLSSGVRSVAFRVAREAIANARKHAEAASLHITDHARARRRRGRRPPTTGAASAPRTTGAASTAGWSSARTSSAAPAAGGRSTAHPARAPRWSSRCRMPRSSHRRLRTARAPRAGPRRRRRGALRARATTEPRPRERFSRPTRPARAACPRRSRASSNATGRPLPRWGASPPARACGWKFGRPFSFSVIHSLANSPLRISPRIARISSFVCTVMIAQPPRRTRRTRRCRRSSSSSPRCRPRR